MSYSLASTSVFASGLVATQNISTAHKRITSYSDAVDIGDLNIKKEETDTQEAQQSTSLQVSSKLTGSSTSQYYKFSLSGADIKLDFKAESPSTRVVLYDKKGKIVADSQGNVRQRANFIALTSGSGLSSKSGDYTLEIAYSKKADTTKDIKYGLKLYTGNSYEAVYKNVVQAPEYDTSIYGAIESATDALLFAKSAYNKIDVTAATAITIGWMKQDESMLNVLSQLTKANHTNYYSFTLTEGDNLKFGFNSKRTTDPTQFQVQLLDATGIHVFADSHGTEAQKKAYDKFTSLDGLTAKAGNYVIKTSYAPDVFDRTTQTYEFGIFSGTTYSAKYTTTASAQTYANALLLGEVGGTARSSAIAAYLTAQMNEDDTYAASVISDALRKRY